MSLARGTKSRRSSSAVKKAFLEEGRAATEKGRAAARANAGPDEAADVAGISPAYGPTVSLQ